VNGDLEVPLGFSCAELFSERELQALLGASSSFLAHFVQEARCDHLSGVRAMVKHGVMHGVLTLASMVSMFVEIGIALEKTDKGKVKAVSVGKLTMTDVEGKNERSYAIPAESKVMLNDRESKLTDLQQGDAVTVTLGMEGEVTLVSAKRSKTPVSRECESAMIDNEKTESLFRFAQ
jgi:hypothetical protein